VFQKAQLTNTEEARVRRHCAISAFVQPFSVTDIARKPRYHFLLMLNSNKLSVAKCRTHGYAICAVNNNNNNI